MSRRVSGIACIALGVALLALSGCVTRVDPVAPTFVPNEREGVVYGTMEFVVNGWQWPPDTRVGLIKPEIGAEISRFQGLDELTTGSFRSGDLIIHAMVRDGGDFVAKLPVGRYYFVTFGYHGVGPDGIAVWRTYSDMIFSGQKVDRAMLVMFDVVPNKATYIGTMRHLISEGGSGLQTSLGFGMQIRNEFGAATARILQPYPQLQPMAESHMVTIYPLPAPIK